MWIKNDTVYKNKKGNRKQSIQIQKEVRKGKFIHEKIALHITTFGVVGKRSLIPKVTQDNYGFIYEITNNLKIIAPTIVLK